MKNIINSFDLDFAADIPLEISILTKQCEHLKIKNKKLRIALTVLFALLGIYIIYKARVRNLGKHENQ